MGILLISDGNDISTSFCVRKLYFHCPQEKKYDLVPQSIIISLGPGKYLHTKGCGNAPFLLFISSLFDYYYVKNTTRKMSRVDLFAD